MSRNRLRTSVTTVPARVNHRIHSVIFFCRSSSPLRGKNTSASAKAVGAKMTADISIRSHSGAVFIRQHPELGRSGFLRSRASLHGEHVRNQHKQSDGRDSQEQN